MSMLTVLSCLIDAPPEDVGVLPKEGDTKFRHGGIVVRRGTHNIMGICGDGAETDSASQYDSPSQRNLLGCVVFSRPLLRELT